MIPKFIFSILLLSTLLFACTNQPKESKVNDDGLIQVTKAQFESENMEYGIPKSAAFSDLIHFTGTIIPSVNGWAQISLPVPGVIHKIYCKPGQMLSKGSLLIEVSGNELIDMQRAFAESASLLIRLKSEYENAKVLNGENIGSKKEFILAESAYRTEIAKFNALKIKLENIKLDVEKIADGIFYSSYSLRSPIQGNVTKINVMVGQYIESQEDAAEIIDNQSFQLKLSVFEKDIPKVKVNQTAEFYFGGDKNRIIHTTINAVGKTINHDTKSVDCFAEIDNLAGYNFVNNQFVEGDISVSTDSVFALPETAIVKTANKSYVLMYEKEAGDLFYFRKTEVTTGRTHLNSIELTGKLPEGKLLVKGIYNLHFD